MRPSTVLQQFDAAPGDAHHPSSTPIYQTATFHQDPTGDGTGFDYSRSGNPTRQVLERRLAKLEHGKQAFTFSSGMAAIASVVGMLPKGARLLAATDLYGGCWRYLHQVAAPRGLEVQLVDTTDLVAVRIELQKGADLLLLESPTNPRMLVSDIAALARLCRKHACLLAVDNSLMTPLRQQPLKLGADLVLHSATKFLGGHADVTAGAVVATDPTLCERLAFLQNAEGNALAPFDSWLLSRGLSTLELRLRQQEVNTKALLAALCGQGTVRRVYHPSLGPPDSVAIQRQQALGFGTVISFTTGDCATSHRFMESLQLFSIAVSFGSLQSTVGMPCAMSHASIPEEDRHFLALPEDLVRLSCGIEDSQDLTDDFYHAFQAMQSEVEVVGGIDGKVQPRPLA